MLWGELHSHSQVLDNEALLPFWTVTQLLGPYEEFLNFSLLLWPPVPSPGLGKRVWPLTPPDPSDNSVFIPQVGISRQWAKAGLGFRELRS